MFINIIIIFISIKNKRKINNHMINLNNQIMGRRNSMSNNALEAQYPVYSKKFSQNSLQQRIDQPYQKGNQSTNLSAEQGFKRGINSTQNKYSNNVPGYNKHGNTSMNIPLSINNHHQYTPQYMLPPNQVQYYHQNNQIKSNQMAKSSIYTYNNNPSVTQFSLGDNGSTNKFTVLRNDENKKNYPQSIIDQNLDRNDIKKINKEKCKPYTYQSMITVSEIHKHEAPPLSKIDELFKNKKRKYSIQKNEEEQNTGKKLGNNNVAKNLAEILHQNSQPQENLSNSRQIELKFTVNSFTKLKTLGCGKYGSVFLVREKYTGFICALKQIQKKTILEQKITEQFIRELKIQMYLNHPNIIKMYGYFEDQLNIYIILEVGTDGPLYHQLKSKQLPEVRVSNYMRQVCQAVRQLHINRIIHRDIKPQNIVLQDNVIKLCDFGWSVRQDSSLRTTFCGTPLYVCPQILKGEQYDEQIDIWSLGVMMYEMSIGENPFKITKQQQLIKIIKDEVKIPQYVNLSKQLHDFLQICLKKNPKQRATIKQLVAHQFFKNHPDKQFEKNKLAGLC